MVMRRPLPCIGLLATLLGSTAQVAHAAPPDDSMLAPAMQPAPTLRERTVRPNTSPRLAVRS